MPVIHHPQFVPISRDEKKRIVGARPKDQNGQDPGDGGIESDTRQGSDTGRDDGRKSVRETDNDERNQPEPGASIGDQEQDGDDEDGRQQEGEIRTLEYRREVDGEPLGAGQLGTHTRGEVVSGDGTYLLCTFRLRGNIRYFRERNDDQRGGAIARNLRRGNEFSEGKIGKRGRLGVDRSEVCVGEPGAGAAEDDDCGGRVGARQTLLHDRNSSRFGGDGETDPR